MADRKCVGCETTEDHVFMFMVNIYDEALDKLVDEVYCNECIANIITDLPEIVSSLEAI